METATNLEVETPSKARTVCDICGVLSDEYSRDWLFHGVNRNGLTRKQYYTRINRLREAGLIGRNGASFVLTSLGKIIYETHKTIKFAIHNSWRLQAIDSLDYSPSAAGMPVEQKHKLISALMSDHEVIKNILLQQSDHGSKE